MHCRLVPIAPLWFFLPFCYYRYRLKACSYNCYSHNFSTNLKLVIIIFDSGYTFFNAVGTIAFNAYYALIEKNTHNNNNDE